MYVWEWLFFVPVFELSPPAAEYPVYASMKRNPASVVDLLLDPLVVLVLPPAPLVVLVLPPLLLVDVPPPPAEEVYCEPPPALLVVFVPPPLLVVLKLAPPPEVACEYERNGSSDIFSFTAFTIRISAGIKKFNFAFTLVVAFACTLCA